MFTQDEFIIDYPSKSVVVDVLSRSGQPDEFSFTPFMGREDLIYENIKEDPAFNINRILENRSDFDPRKNYDSKTRDDDLAIDVSKDEYYKLSTHVTQANINEFCRFIIIAYTSLDNNSDFKKKKFENKPRELISSSTDNGEVLIDESDLIEKKSKKWDKEKEEAAKSIPFYLKMLQQGSIYYECNLLSFIISKHNCISRRIDLKPKNILGGLYGKCYDCDKNGRSTKVFNEQNNNNEQVRTALAWVKGEFPEDPYYKIYKKLLIALDILDIDILTENVLDYKPEVIKNAVCTYLISNEEYVEDFGMVDRKLMNELSPASLFKIQNSFSAEDILNSKNLENTLVMDDMDYTISKFLSYLNDRLNSDDFSIKSKAKYEFLKDRFDELNEFLKLFNKSVDNFEIDRHGFLIKRSDAGIATISKSNVLFYNTFGAKCRIMFHKSGNLISTYNGNDSTFYTIKALKAASYMEQGKVLSIDEWENRML